MSWLRRRKRYVISVKFCGSSADILTTHALNMSAKKIAVLVVLAALAGVIRTECASRELAFGGEEGSTEPHTHGPGTKPHGH
jgi:hypothetical protein